MAAIETITAGLDTITETAVRQAEQALESAAAVDSSSFPTAAVIGIITVAHQTLFNTCNSSIQAVLQQQGILQPFQNPALTKARECSTALQSDTFKTRSRREVAAMSEGEFYDYEDTRDEYERKLRALQEANLTALKTMQEQCSHYATITKRVHNSNVAKRAVLGTVVGFVAGPLVAPWGISKGVLPAACEGFTAAIAGGAFWCLVTLLIELRYYLRHASKKLKGAATGGTFACVVTGIQEYDKYTENLVWLEQQTSQILAELGRNDLAVKDMQVVIEQWRKVLEQFKNKHKQIVGEC